MILASWSKRSRLTLKMDLSDFVLINSTVRIGSVCLVLEFDEIFYRQHKNCTL